VTVSSLELANAAWRKSSYSANNGTCVEVAALTDGRVAVRNSNHPDAGTLVLDRAAVAGWLAGIKAGEFDTMA
jgi:Domain of unknown function (DUF397)